MQFPKSSPELIELFASLIPSGPDITNRKIFGYPACFINGNMFTGLHGLDMILRLPEESRAEFIKQTNSNIFEPMPGRKMKEYVVVPNGLIGRDINSWLDISMTYVRNLPPKVKKTKT